MWASGFQTPTQLTGVFKKRAYKTICAGNCKKNSTALILTMMEISQKRSCTFSSEMRSKYMMKKFDIRWSTKYLTKLILMITEKYRLKNSSWSTSIPVTNSSSGKRKSWEISSTMPDSKMKLSSNCKKLHRLNANSWPQWASAATLNWKCISLMPRT